MKFFSKNANLMIVLKQGLPGNNQLGTATTPGLYARFKDGQIDIKDPGMVELMLKHPGMDVDFVKVNEEVEIDPYAGKRAQSEPTHVISEMEFGHPKRVTQPPTALTPEMRAAMMEVAKPMAIELAKAMLPSMIQETLKSMSQAQASENTAEEKAEQPVVNDAATAPKAKAKK